jgi:2-C-methyl-D-erythritol 4-phosphate cytidylyltransferase/2-C-methyl-D-erythritol 2,4-cyclodiphosphate synthase
MYKKIALILAAGKGERFGSTTAKQYQPLLGRRTIDWSIDLFQSKFGTQNVYAVASPDNETILPITKITGGITRQQSVLAGLTFLKECAEVRDDDLVFIHDAARPCVTAELIERLAAKAQNHGSAIPLLPVVDTLRRIDDSGASSIQPRENLHAAQTPQVFRFIDIHTQHLKHVSSKVTDDAALFEIDGKKLHFCPGDADNIKITHPSDLPRAEAILSQRLGDIRTGKGFDVHRLIPATENRPLMLGGIAIPHHMTLDGHSDADVVLHAVTDAVLGALCAGDIGVHFPPSDMRWKNAQSHLFLRHAVQMVQRQQGVISHVDVTLLCEAPKISPHRDAMRQKIADIMSLNINRVSVKATTTEKLGFTGRGEGIAAEAVVTVRLPFSSNTGMIAA